MEEKAGHKLTSSFLDGPEGQQDYEILLQQLLLIPEIIVTDQWHQLALLTGMACFMAKRAITFVKAVHILLFMID